MFQPVWQKLHHVSLIGMNHWGGASTYHSGEIPALLYMIDKLNKKDALVVFDVGANAGQYALMANRYLRNGIIHSFEPSGKTFELLNSNTHAHSSIVTHNIGLGEERTSMTLYSSGPLDTIASLHRLKNRENALKSEFSEEIEVDTIDSFCDAHGISCIDILKLDIEGHEFHALKGAAGMLRNSKINFIQFEFSEFNIDSRTYFRDFYDLLSPDYRLYRIVPDGLTELKTYHESLEIFHTANFLAERRALDLQGRE